MDSLIPLLEHGSINDRMVGTFSPTVHVLSVVVSVYCACGGARTSGANRQSSISFRAILSYS